jgi:raffinose/stachyose/melibiose transport system permease protein
MKLHSAPLAAVRKKRGQNLSLIFFVLPALVCVRAVQAVSGISGVYYAMTDWNGVSKTVSFIGLDNFVRVFGDDYFWQSILFTLKYVAAWLLWRTSLRSCSRLQ